MGLDKNQRALKKAIKEQKKRETRRKEKEWFRNQDASTWKGFSGEWCYEDGIKRRYREPDSG